MQVYEEVGPGERKGVAERWGEGGFGLATLLAVHLVYEPRYSKTRVFCQFSNLTSLE